jgi:hypothetical protein
MVYLKHLSNKVDILPPQPAECPETHTRSQCQDIQHNDEPGRKHTALVARSLYGPAANVKLVHLPDLPEHGERSWE